MNPPPLISRPEPPHLRPGKAARIAGLTQRYQVSQVAGIPAQWARFRAYEGKIPGQIGRNDYGVCYNCDETGSFDYLCGVEVGQTAPLLPEFSSVLLPEQQYAVFSHRGPLSGIGATFAAILNEWLPRSGYRAAETPSFELYPDNFDPKENPTGVEIWLPIRT